MLSLKDAYSRKDYKSRTKKRDNLVVFDMDLSIKASVMLLLILHNKTFIVT